MTNHLAALYGFQVRYYEPRERDMRYGRSGYGHFHVAPPVSKAWEEAWTRASRTEKARYCRWTANVICRVWAGLVEESHEVDAVAPRISGTISDAVDPLKAADDDIGPASLFFSVESDEAKQWIARARALINEVIASDAAILAMSSQEHTGLTLAQPATTPEEQHR